MADRGDVGIIGCGNVTLSTVGDLVAAGARVAWVADPSSAARASVAHELALVQGFAPVEFDDVDSALARGGGTAPVLINSPGSLHLDHIERCASRQRPMLVAKPLGLDWNESERAIAIADDAGVGIEVAEQYPDEAHALQVRDLIRRHGPARRILLDHRKPASGQTTLAGKHQTGILEYAVHHYALLESWVDQRPSAIAVDTWTGNSGHSGEGSIGHAWIHYDSCHVLHAFGFGGEWATYRAEIETEGAVITATGPHFASPDVELSVVLNGDVVRTPPVETAASAWDRLYTRWLESPADRVPLPARRRIRVVAAMVDAALRAAETGAVVDLSSDSRYRDVW